jgi:hypothetical protein
LLRRARGYAPLPVADIESSRTLLGVGAHLKSSIALVVGGQVVMSQHLGDLDGPENIALLERTIDDLLRFFDTTRSRVICIRTTLRRGSPKSCARAGANRSFACSIITRTSPHASPNTA